MGALRFSLTGLVKPGPKRRKKRCRYLFLAGDMSALHGNQFVRYRGFCFSDLYRRMKLIAQSPFTL